MQRRMLRASLKGPPVIPFKANDGYEPAVDSNSGASSAVFDMFESLYAGNDIGVGVLEGSNVPSGDAEQNKDEVLTFLKTKLHEKGICNIWRFLCIAEDFVENQTKDVFCFMSLCIFESAAEEGCGKSYLSWVLSTLLYPSDDCL